MLAFAVTMDVALNGMDVAMAARDVPGGGQRLPVFALMAAVTQRILDLVGDTAASSGVGQRAGADQTRSCGKAVGRRIPCDSNRRPGARRAEPAGRRCYLQRTISMPQGLTPLRPQMLMVAVLPAGPG